MSATLPFLQALGLDHDTDERAVRRAYAQRLKLIDLDADPHGFQLLRSHYEHALQWLAYRMRQQHEEVAQEEQQGLDSESPESPAAAAMPERAAEDRVAEAPTVREPAADELVFESFLAQVQLGFRSEDDARKALDAALDDERLINLSARGTFEGRIAALLMNGWKPGHEFLFGPACERFDWERNARQLQAYGQLGAVLNAAINEKLIFFRQDATHFNLQRNVIREMRWSEAPSSTQQLVSTAPTLQVLAQRYPNWLHAIAPSENIRHWLKLYEELPPKQRERKLNVAQQQRAYQEEGSSVPPPKKKWYQFGSAGSTNGWHIIWIVLLLARCISHTAPSPPSNVSDLDLPGMHVSVPVQKPLLPPRSREPTTPEDLVRAVPSPGEQPNDGLVLRHAASFRDDAVPVLGFSSPPATQHHIYELDPPPKPSQAASKPAPRP